jgi:pantothenate synthetase
MRPDYFLIRSADDLSIPGVDVTHLVVLAAARSGSTRLIDNLRLDLR